MMSRDQTPPTRGLWPAAIVFGILCAAILASGAALQLFAALGI